MSRRRNKKNRRPASSPTSVSQSQPLLQQAELKIESQLTPEVKDNYLKIVVAGMKAGMAGGPDSIMAKLRDSKNVVADCAKGAIGLVMILRSQAKGIMPMNAMIPAAATLMLKALSFAEQMGLAKIGTPEIENAMRIFNDTFLGKLGVTPPMMQHAMKKVDQLSQDPVAMEMMKRKAGFVKHPEASEPTPLPEGA